jgi:hypothetical protein
LNKFAGEIEVDESYFGVYTKEEEAVVFQIKFPFWDY